MNRVLIAEITDKSLNLPTPEPNEFRLRKSARGILKNGNKIALLNMTKENYHKLPGGGIDKNESIEDGFKREILEETGCKCEITDSGGLTIEFRNEEEKIQISYVYFAEVVGEAGAVKFEQDEIDEGAQLEWVNINEIENVLAKDTPQAYDTLFIHKRDRAIIEHYTEKLQS